MLLWRALYDAGVFVNVALHPAVPPGGALLRTSVMATHDRATLDRALAAFGEVKQRFEAEHGPLPAPRVKPRLGRLGVWRRHQPGPGIVPELEALGYDTLWLGSSPSLEQARAVPGGVGGDHDRHRDPQHLAARAGRRRGPARGADPRLPGQLPARHRRRAPRGHERLHAAAERDARVLRRPRRAAAGAARRADRRRARAEDARPRGRALARHAPLLHDARAHALRARAGRAGRARRPGARGRGRDRPRARPRGRARLRRDLPRAHQLHVEPAALRLHRGRHRRRRLATA